MSEELKPCPFCGGEASASSRMDEDLSTHNQVEWKKVGCDSCEVYFEIPDGYDCGTAAEQWNTRPALKDRDVVLEEAAERAAFVAGYRAAHMVPDAYDSTSAAEEAWEGYRLVSRNLKERV